jgi:hypothetical protein
MIFVRFIIGFMLFCMSLAMVLLLKIEFEATFLSQIWKVLMASVFIAYLAYIFEGKHR